MEETTWKVAWKSASWRHGGPSATQAGVQKMPESCADNLDFQDTVSTNPIGVALTCTIDLDR